MCAIAETSLAQPKEPIGRFVADVRGASAGLPAIEGWTPTVPEGTQVPNRSLGLEVGAHVYPLRTRIFALGIGATWLIARGTTKPAEPETEDTAPPTNTIPDVTTRLTSFAPQLSLNFGHSLGWSYLSAGLGSTRVKSEAILSPGTTIFTPRDSGWAKTLNFGGGARWFINDRLGVTLDLRWHKLSILPASATHPGAPRASLLTASAGISFK
jgi:hypothetical protein